MSNKWNHLHGKCLLEEGIRKTDKADKQTVNEYLNSQQKTSSEISGEKIILAILDMVSMDYFPHGIIDGDASPILIAPLGPEYQILSRNTFRTWILKFNYEKSFFILTQVASSPHLINRSKKWTVNRSAKWANIAIPRICTFEDELCRLVGMHL